MRVMMPFGGLSVACLARARAGAASGFDQNTRLTAAQSRTTLLNGGRHDKTRQEGDKTDGHAKV
jgi:hypothetical protein